MSLYTKYRPKNFDEVVGQDSVVSNLSRAVADDKVGHAYVFSGPRGTGKTTVARLLASAVGAESIDLMEVDAASTRGIDDIREIRSGSILAPNGKAKAYILDEAHQLTPQAWDALLKTLEEPPPRCYFILCTTSPDKVPPTVRSRCQMFPFRPASTADILTVLKRVTKAEKIKLTAGVANELAVQARGSFRDALTILEQLAAGGDFSSEALQGQVGAATAEDCYVLFSNTATGQVAEVLSHVERLHAGGADLGRVVTALLELLRRVLEAKFISTAPEDERELAVLLGNDKIFELSDSLARAAEIAARAGNTRLALEAALAKAAT